MKENLIKLGKQAKKSFDVPVTSKIKDKVLQDYSNLIFKNQLRIIRENKKDLKTAKKKKLKENLIKRLLLDEKKIIQILNSIKTIRKFKNPVDQILKSWKRPNGLNISKVTTPIGVIAVIYESRPNVTSDVASLCFKSGNPVILKGGTEAYYSNKILTNLFRDALEKNKINKNYVQFINLKKRKVVDYLLTKMINYIDVIIPRGGKSLVKKVQHLSKIPVIGHLEGVCHTYIDKDANISMAKKITLKQKTKSRVKEVAFNLIKLYAKRKLQKGFQYRPDSAMQLELESSFVYEDTPDQITSTAAIKADMESERPMDRLVCGDVGFGKTEVAIRAAFKAVDNGKQVAVLVPTTILAFQHAKTFGERLKEFPVTVGYLNRFKTAKQKRETLEQLSSGALDILIGTHQLVNKSVQFKDLGLLIVDEEQKFGVAVKDKLKTLKENVDVLTLTATPIPRTLQFSLMAARDLSVITTAPPNRYPIESHVIRLSETIIRDAISYEIQRAGQVFFIHNRIENIREVAGMIQRLVPDAKIAVGHGQLEGKKLEQLMLNFMEGAFDAQFKDKEKISGKISGISNSTVYYRKTTFVLTGRQHSLLGF